MSVIAFLRRVLRLGPPAHFRRVVHVWELPDVPTVLAADAIYVAGRDALPKWAVFRCPCERGHRVTLPLQGYPRWSVRYRRGGPTMSPSVDVRGDWSGGRRCHYGIRNGRVTWVSDLLHADA